MDEAHYMGFEEIYFPIPFSLSDEYFLFTITLLSSPTHTIAYLYSPLLPTSWWCHFSPFYIIFPFCYEFMLKGSRTRSFQGVCCNWSGLKDWWLLFKKLLEQKIYFKIYEDHGRYCCCYSITMMSIIFSF